MTDHGHIDPLDVPRHELLDAGIQLLTDQAEHLDLEQLADELKDEPT